MTWGRVKQRWSSGRLAAVLAAAVLVGSCGRAPTPIRIDAGGPGYRGSDNVPWLADHYFAGGVTFTTQHDIYETPEPAIYKTVRFGNSFRYSIPAPNGPATVKLLFAEVYFEGPGKRVFNVSINDKPALTKFDPVAAAGGPFRAIEKDFNVSVTNGQIAILFTPIAEDPMVNAIEVLPGRT